MDDPSSFTKTLACYLHGFLGILKLELNLISGYYILLLNVS